MASINPLSAQSASYDAASHEVVLTYKDLDTTAGDTANTAVVTDVLFSADSVEFLSWEITRPFSGGTVVASTLSVGDAALATVFAAAKQIADAHATTIERWGTKVYDPAPDGTLRFTFGAGGAGKKLNEYTDGEIRARFRINNAASSVNAG